MDFRNRLLAALPPDERQRLQPHLEPVVLRSRQVVHFKHVPIEHLYFIEEGLVSVLADTGGTEVTEVWLIGREGVVGLPVILGGIASPHRRVVQVKGHAFRIAADDLRRAMEERLVLRRLLLRYAQAVLIQASQAGACANRHSLHQRLARWLLSAQYRLGKNVLPLTHALLARLVGARRASITVAMGALETAEIIGQRRGEITILDGDRLEQAACNCHRIIRAAYESITREEPGRANDF